MAPASGQQAAKLPHFGSALTAGLIGTGTARQIFGAKPDPSPGVTCQDCGFFTPWRGLIIGTLLRWVILAAGAGWLWGRARRRALAEEEARAAWSDYIRHGLQGDAADAALHEPPLAAPLPLVPAVEEAPSLEITLAPEPEENPAPDEECVHRLVLGIHSAWSSGDIESLRLLTAPALLSALQEELAANAARGLANKVEQSCIDHLALLDVDAEAATAMVQVGWRALDYMARLGRAPHDPDYIAGGSMTAPVAAQEIWTLQRREDGRWVLAGQRTDGQAAADGLLRQAAS